MCPPLAPRHPYLVPMDQEHVLNANPIQTALSSAKASLHLVLSLSRHRTLNQDVAAVQTRTVYAVKPLREQHALALSKPFLPIHNQV